MIGSFEGADVELLRALGNHIVKEPRRVALLAAPGEGFTSIFVARGLESAFDCGAFVREVTRLTGGRGGGRKERAEGRLPGLVDWPALVAQQTLEP